MHELKIAKLSFPSRRQPAVNHACLWERLGQKDGFDIFADPPGSALLVGVVCLRARQQGGQEGDELRENAGADRSDAAHREPGEQVAPEPLPHPTRGRHRQRASPGTNPEVCAVCGEERKERSTWPPG